MSMFPRLRVQRCRHSGRSTVIRACPAPLWLVLLFVLAGRAWSADPELSADPEQSGDRPSDAEIGEAHVYSTPDEAIREIFEGVAEVSRHRVGLTSDELARIRAETGANAPTDTLDVLCPRDGTGALLGYALVDEEVGKYRPITFLVGTRVDLAVEGVEVLVYRESRGGEVQKQRFLRQYRAKSADDPIRINKDILNIAGATLSVRALNLGVRRVLVSLELLEGRGELPTS